MDSCKNLDMNLEPLLFQPLSMERREEYQELFNRCSEKASDYTFINIWGWSEERRYEWAFAHGLCWLRAFNGQTPVWWAPVGNWDRSDWMKVLSAAVPPGTVFERTPEALANIWKEQLKDRILIEEQRSEWEYLYDHDKMVALSGNKYHRKKNLLAQFKKLYDYEYGPICFKCLDKIRQMQEEWCRWRGCEESPGLAAENTAIARVLQEWERLPGILGGSLSVFENNGNGADEKREKKIIAYTVAEDLGNGTVVIHFEKGLDSYKGVYQAVNQMFLAGLSGFHTVNREQDMGSEGIRKAKESYNPSGFLKKYKVTWPG